VTGVVIDTSAWIAFFRGRESVMADAVNRLLRDDAAILVGPVLTRTNRRCGAGRLSATARLRRGGQGTTGAQWGGERPHCGARFAALSSCVTPSASSYNRPNHRRSGGLGLYRRTIEAARRIIRIERTQGESPQPLGHCLCLH